MTGYEADFEQQIELCLELEPEEPRLKIYEIIYGTFMEPTATFKRVSREQPLALTFVLVVLVYVFTRSVGLFGTMPINLPSGGSLNMGSLAWLYALIGLPVSLMIWIIMSALYSLIGSIFYGKNNVKGLMCTLGLSLLPGILTPSVNYLSKAFDLAWWAILPVGLFFAVWAGGLQVLAIRESLMIDTSKAFIMWIVPLAVVFVIIILAFIGIAGMTASLI